MCRAAAAQPARTAAKSLFQSLPHYPQLCTQIGPQAASRETWWMIESIVNQPKAQLVQSLRLQPAAHSHSITHLLSQSHQSKLQQYLYQRTIERQPLQYILQTVKFLDLNLITRPPVLIPRPETEQLCAWCVEQVLGDRYTRSTQHLQTYNYQLQSLLNLTQSYEKLQQTMNNATTLYSSAIQHPQPVKRQQSIRAMHTRQTQQPFNILDLCSGSGNIALSTTNYLRASGMNVQAVGVDYSTDAIQLANDNATKLKLDKQCHFVQGDVYQPLLPQQIVNQSLSKPTSSTDSPWHADLIISNPPYITPEEYVELEAEIEAEDYFALVSGHRGVEIHQAIIKMSHSLLKPVEQCTRDIPDLVFEIGGQHQVQPIVETLESFNYQHITIHRDAYHKHRWIAARRQPYVQ